MSNRQQIDGGRFSLAVLWFLLAVILVLSGCSESGPASSEGESAASERTVDVPAVTWADEVLVERADPSTIRISSVTEGTALGAIRSVYRAEYGIIPNLIWLKRESEATESLYLHALREAGFAEGEWLSEIPESLPGPYLPAPHALYEVTLTTSGSTFLLEQRSKCSWSKYGCMVVAVARVEVLRVTQLVEMSFPIKGVAIEFEYRLGLTDVGERLLEDGTLTMVEPLMGISLEGTELESTIGRTLAGDAVVAEYSDGWGFPDEGAPSPNEWLYRQTGPAVASGTGSANEEMRPEPFIELGDADETGELEMPATAGHEGVFSFGRNRDDDGRGGQLGLEDTDHRHLPVHVDLPTNTVSLAAGNTHSLALTADGAVYSFGVNRWGDLGLGDRTDRNSPTAIEDLTDVQAVAVGYNHNFAVLSDGRVFAWGANNAGQLGLGHKAHPQPRPVEVTSLAGVVEVAAGAWHTLFLLRNGDVYSCGWGQWGALGHGDQWDQRTPKKIDAITNAVAIAAGDQSSLVVLQGGDVYSFGLNDHGQLGQGDTANRLSPTKISTLSGAASVESGYTHSFVLRQDGGVYAFGSNQRGQLGLGDVLEHLAPEQVMGIPAIDQIAAGAQTLFLDTQGKVFACGGNPYGQLGLGDSEDRWLPTAVPSLRGAEFIAAGGGHSLVLVGGTGQGSVSPTSPDPHLPGKESSQPDDDGAIDAAAHPAPEDTATPSRIFDGFALSRGIYSETDDLEASARAEFGLHARVADWNEIASRFDGRGEAFLNGVGLDYYGATALVYRGGMKYWQENRHFFVSRHDHVPPVGFLVHSDLDDHTLDLGSWYGLRMPILVKLP